ncbi:MAG: MBL fold metallo-hydrolase [Gammaproteobacteria bacterium]|nr:MBL fold metallo-hydrolase [Gammaproteobacteria bacterium]
MRVSYERSVIDQLEALGHAPADIERVAFSHMHFDHSGAANAFAASTLLIQRTEYVAAFVDGDENPVFQPDLYMGLEQSRKVLLDGDHDVFGDGRVMILAAPGHTPGHQVLFIDLTNMGPLVLSGDLYHFREAGRCDERRCSTPMREQRSHPWTKSKPSSSNTTLHYGSSTTWRLPIRYDSRRHITTDQDRRRERRA